MYLTIIGLILGGIISWLITHAYYKKSLKESKISDPIPIENAMRSVVDDVNRDTVEMVLKNDTNSN